MFFGKLRVTYSFYKAAFIKEGKTISTSNHMVSPAINNKFDEW